MPVLKPMNGAARTWWALAAALQCHCAAAAASIRPTSDRPSQPEEGYHPAANAAPRGERSPWPGIAALAAPPAAEECTYAATQPWLTWQRESDGLVPVRTGARPIAVDPLPFEPPPQLDVRAGLGGSRKVIKVESGWLVAVDRGEHGGGLYSVRAGTLKTTALDENLAEAIRWIGPSEFGILGVAGFCHGDACALRTTVYEVAPAVVDGGWRLRPLALLKGCPAATELDPAGKSLVVAVHCGALHRISAQATSDIATWPAHLSPSQLLVTRSADGSGPVYSVSFGRFAARFRAHRAEWFAPFECASAVAEPSGHCRCVSATQ